MVKDMNGYPGIEVLVKTLFYLKLLRPLTVVPLVLHVDAWF